MTAPFAHVIVTNATGPPMAIAGVGEMLTAGVSSMTSAAIAESVGAAAAW